ncbi:MAG: GNAT family N-acetyltransferase [Ilyomonas sp.]
MKEDLFLIKAQIDDADLLFKWINEPSVRAQSYSNNLVKYEEHMAWFSKKMQDRNCYIYLGKLRQEPIGMIRFDIANDEVLISYLIDEQFRGKGLGYSLVEKGVKNFLLESNFGGIIKASVKKSNIPSVKVFQKLLFEKMQNNVYPDSFLFIKKI